jgi:hypothetical protein
MVNVWARFFIPALLSSIAGVSFFLLTLGLARLDALLAPGGGAVSPPASPQPLPAMHPWVWVAVALALLMGALGGAAYYRRRGPRLGFED